MTAYTSARCRLSNQRTMVSGSRALPVGVDHQLQKDPRFADADAALFVQPERDGIGLKGKGHG